MFNIQNKTKRPPEVALIKKIFSKENVKKCLILFNLIFIQHQLYLKVTVYLDKTTRI